uniref:Ubiquitin thioesterase OTU n=1 Tax=Aureoumbra lagunensis TaxID=44058 RepID=A0A7S3NPU2_9STRA|mmetsp:Transcript_16933/g.25473  ORF Transcript_16933/g.25473 Transcript_16933/m.25473 type:complete len:306 (+) Transcript_16933:19-936(+)
MGGGSVVSKRRTSFEDNEETTTPSKKKLNGMSSKVERIRVPGDLSCLFYSAAYLVEDAPANEETQRRLRQVVYEHAAADPEREIRELYLERSIEDYREWILNEFHEGGEQELIALAAYYKVRFAIVSTESLTILTYGDEDKPIGYLLYTGTHYDPLISAGSPNGTRLWRQINPEFETACIELAKNHNDSITRRNKSEKIYRIRCCGCGAKLLDNEDFQRHCSEVDHDDDFAFDCEEIFHVTYQEEDMNLKNNDHNYDNDFAAAAAIAAQEAEEGPPAGRTRNAQKSLLRHNLHHDISSCESFVNK